MPLSVCPSDLHCLWKGSLVGPGADLDSVLVGYRTQILRYSVQLLY
jgi:hypothetical protein